MSNAQKYLEKILGWVIDSVVHNTVHISKYKPLIGTH